MCRELISKGIDVLLVTTDADLELKENLPAQINYNNVPRLFFSSQAGSSFKYSRSMAKWLDHNVNKFDLVHVHAVFNHACISATRSCRKRNVPYVVRPLGTLDPWSMSQKRFKKRLFWIVAGRSMIRNSAGIHYTSEAEKFRTETTLNLRRGAVVPLGIEISLSDPQSGEIEFQDNFVDISRRPYVLVLSRLDPKKGIPPLIRSFLSLRSEARFSDWQLVIAGTGKPEYRVFLEEFVREQGGAGAVHFTGWLSGEQKAAFLQNAGLLALTSYQENFGLCVMEAMSFGVPVLVSSHVDLSSEVLRTNAGWVVDVEEPSLTRGLSEALSSKDERCLRGNAGRELSKLFSWDRIGNDLIRMYSDISPK